MEEERKKEKKENSTELQKPKLEAEVYNNSKKMWLGWGKAAQKFIGFLIANKINNCNRRGEKGKKEKIQTNLQNMSKNKDNNCFSWVTAVRVLFRTGNHSPPYLPRMPSNAVLISGRAVGAAQILIWSYSCVFLPPMCTTIRASAFSFVGALNGLLYIP